MWIPDERRSNSPALAALGFDLPDVLLPFSAECRSSSVLRETRVRGPMLQKRFLPPANFVWGSFISSDGAKLRWGHLSVAKARAQCVLVGGFGEFIEKQFETIRDLARQGIEVWCLEWRGQGRSTRPRFLPTRPRARNFDRDADELAAFTVAKLNRSLPRLLIAHSMGGAIGLICLRQHPSLFAAGILSSPMLGLRIGRLPPILLRCITKPARALGLGLCFIPGVRKWCTNGTGSPTRSKASSDPVRCIVSDAWLSHEPSLRMDGVTYSWLDSALALIARIQKPSFLTAIRTPILLGAPEHERVVSSSAQRQAASFIQDCTLVELSGSKHDPFLECDKIREEWLRRIERFIFEQVAQREDSRLPPNPGQSSNPQEFHLTSAWHHHRSVCQRAPIREKHSRSDSSSG